MVQPPMFATPGGNPDLAETRFIRDITSLKYTSYRMIQVVKEHDDQSHPTDQCHLTLQGLILFRNHKMNPIKLYCRTFLVVGVWYLETRFKSFGPKRCIKP